VYAFVGIVLLSQSITTTGFVQSTLEYKTHTAAWRFGLLMLTMAPLFMAMIFTTGYGAALATIGLAAYVATGRGFGHAHDPLGTIIGWYTATHLNKGFYWSVIALFAIFIWFNPTLIFSFPMFMIIFSAYLVPFLSNVGAVPGIRGVPLLNYFALHEDDFFSGGRLLRDDLKAIESVPTFFRLVNHTFIYLGWMLFSSTLIYLPLRTLHFVVKDRRMYRLDRALHRADAPTRDLFRRWNLNYIGPLMLTNPDYVSALALAAKAPRRLSVNRPGETLSRVEALHQAVAANLAAPGFERRFRQAFGLRGPLEPWNQQYGDVLFAQVRHSPEQNPQALASGIGAARLALRTPSGVRLVRESHTGATQRAAALSENEKLMTVGIVSGRSGEFVIRRQALMERLPRAVVRKIRLVPVPGGRNAVFAKRAAQASVLIDLQDWRDLAALQDFSGAVVDRYQDALRATLANEEAISGVIFGLLDQIDGARMSANEGQLEEAALRLRQLTALPAAEPLTLNRIGGRLALFSADRMIPVMPVELEKAIGPADIRIPLEMALVGVDGDRLLSTSQRVEAVKGAIALLRHSAAGSGSASGGPALAVVREISQAYQKLSAAQTTLMLEGASNVVGTKAIGVMEDVFADNKDLIEAEMRRLRQQIQKAGLTGLRLQMPLIVRNDALAQKSAN
ncbi:MAG: hypothetical protein WCG06_05000, partial [Candidatus Omnitrophota bacterium]